MKKNIKNQLIAILLFTKKIVSKWDRINSNLGLALILSLLFSIQNSSAQTKVIKEKLIVGIDGLSYSSFSQAQKLGLFRSFKNFSAHVAPYPSMTDLAWSEVMHTERLFQAQGRIQSVEAVYFDDSTKSIQGDPRDYYRRLAQPKYYMGAFDHFFNPYIEGLMYFPTEEVPKLEVKSVFEALKTTKPKEFHSAYIGAVDSLAHTQKNKLYPLLNFIDSQLLELEKEFKRQQRDVEIILISDHGNIGRFTEGQDEIELMPVDLAQFINSNGYTFKQVLTEDKDIASPLMALGNWAPLYFKNKNLRAHFVNIIKRQDWFELATYVVLNTESVVRVRIASASAEAELSYDKKNKIYYYFPVKGNILELEKKFHSSSTTKQGISEHDSLVITAKTNFIDSPHRIISATTQKNFFYPDMILNIKPGYFISSSLSKFTKMYRTHGSLANSSSLGILTSNKVTNKLPGIVRSKDIMYYIKTDPRHLFKEKALEHSLDKKTVISNMNAKTSKTVATFADDFSQKRIFQILTRFVADSRRFFIVDEIKQILNSFISHPILNKDNLNYTTPSPFLFDISKFKSMEILNPKDIGNITDIIINTGDINQALENDKIKEIQEKFASQPKTLVKISHPNMTQSNEGPLAIIQTHKDKILSSKRLAMKMYQMPFLLERALNIPEKKEISDPRDITFAQSWSKKAEQIQTKQSKANTVFDYASKDTAKTWAKKLFKEIQMENELEAKIFPASMERIYNKNLSESVTIVYIPGIYNSLFDNEIFSLGLDALREDLGLRVLKAPVQSSCSSEYNGNLLLNFLKDDQKNLIENGLQKNKYILLGYSKGGVDALESILLEPRFFSENVLALVTIASPISGSSILNKTDLPFQLVNALSESNTPEVCTNDKTAAKSITPTRMNQFWRKNKNSLIGITRYFSISFVSDPEDSHLFMKATKQIAQFNEDNDGVVTLSSSRFPKELNAIDLGTISADHLSGILSSRFDQKSFMKAIIRTLAEFDIENEKNNFIYNANIILSRVSLFKDKVYNRLTQEDESYQLDKLEFNKQRWFIPELNHYNIKNTFELNQRVIPKFYDPSMDYIPQVKLPANQFPYDPNETLDISKLGNLMSRLKIEPFQLKASPEGINIEFNHKHMVQFRMDYQFLYESRSPIGNDDNEDYGYFPVKYQNAEPWLKMRSKNNSIRMTTMAYRFAPKEFKNMKLKLIVTNGVKEADPVKGKTGIDDSAFQVWFTIREKNTTGDRSILNSSTDNVFLFGYYWGDPVPGENRKPGDIFENWYSNKNVVVATLPEAKMLLLNSPDMLGKPQEFNRNFYSDLKKTFPNKNVDDFDIIAITIQHDSNDANDDSEAYFKYLKILP